MQLAGKSTKDIEYLIRLHRTADWQQQLDGFTEAALKPLLKATTQAQNEIASQLSRWVEHPTPTGFSEDRARSMIQELDGLTAGIRSHLTGSIAEMAGHVGSSSLATHGDILSWGGRVVPFNAVQMSVEQLRQMAIDTPVGGRLLQDWVDRTFDKNLISGIQHEMTVGVLKGDSYPNLVNRIADGWDMTRTEAVTLTRTYVQSANVGAQQAVYQANQDIVKGEVWCATLEIGGKKGGGTCLQCAVLDGKEYLYPDRPPDCPLHPRCRCVILPLTKTWKELGLDVPEMKKAYRAYTHSDEPIHEGRGGRIVTQGFHQGSFSELFPKLPEEQQIAVVGPGRYGLIQKGKISFDDLVDKTTGELRLLEKGDNGEWIGLKPPKEGDGTGGIGGLGGTAPDLTSVVEKIKPLTKIEEFVKEAINWVEKNSEKAWNIDIGYNLENYPSLKDKYDMNTSAGKVETLKSAFSTVAHFAEKGELHRPFSPEVIDLFKKWASDPGSIAMTQAVSAGSSYLETGKWMIQDGPSGGILGMMHLDTPEKLLLHINENPQVAKDLLELYNMAGKLQIDWLEKKGGISSFKAYRGLRLTEEQITELKSTNELIELNGSYWTTEKEFATKFSYDSDNLKGILIEYDIPIKEVANYYGGESVLGHEFGITTNGAKKIKVKVVK